MPAHCAALVRGERPCTKSAACRAAVWSRTRLGCFVVRHVAAASAQRPSARSACSAPRPGRWPRRSGEPAWGCTCRSIWKRAGTYSRRSDTSASIRRRRPPHVVQRQALPVAPTAASLATAQCHEPHAAGEPVAAEAIRSFHVRSGVAKICAAALAIGSIARGSSKRQQKFKKTGGKLRLA